MRTRYRRSDFVTDADWLGLDARRGLSETELRRRRDELMHQHHPDRGGSAEMASRINETYARMSAWLRRRRERSEASRKRHAAEREERVDAAARPAGRWVLAGSMMTTALGAVAAWAVVRGKRR